MIFYPFCLDFLIESWFKKSCDSIVMFYCEPTTPTLHQLVSEPSNFPAMAQRRRDGGNKYASLGVVHKHKETTHDERLIVCL